jgi:uncharacterized protein YegJ (DUF2314 family)
MRSEGLAVVVLLGVTAAGGCKRAAPAAAPARAVAGDGNAVTVGAPIPAGSLLERDGFDYMFVVYATARPPEDPRATSARVLAGGPLALEAGRAPATSARPAVWLEQPSFQEMPLPAKPTLRGLSPADEQAFRRAPAQTFLLFRGPSAQAPAVYPLALALARALAEASHGFVLDTSTLELFSIERWTRRAERFSDGFPDVAAHMMIETYQDERDELDRMNTIGMSKFGLPDLVVNGVTSSNRGSLGTLVNITCQTLLEGGRLAAPGKLALSIDAIKQTAFRKKVQGDTYPNAKRAATIDLAWSERRDGDPDNGLVEIVFPGAAAEVQVRQAALIDQLLGAEDHAEIIEHDDELLAVSARAREAVLAMKPRYRKGRPFRERLLVKAPFRMDDGHVGNEWMWVEVVRWQGKTIRGVLDNDPVHVSSLRAGARVEVDQDSLFDYLLTRADGSEEGNETAKLRHRRSDSASRAGGAASK